MTTYSQITDSEIDPGSPGTENLFTKIRDNPISLLEGDATAPQPAPIVSMVFLDRQEASSSAQLDFTAFDNTIYDAYKFVLTGVRPVTDSVDLWMRVSTNGGASFLAGATNYGYINIYNSVSGTTITARNIASDGDTKIPLTGLLPLGNNLGNGERGYSGVFTLVGAGSAVASTRIRGFGAYDDIGNIHHAGTNSGEYQDLTEVDAVRFLMESGNIAAGTITMYGLRNSYGGSFP